MGGYPPGTSASDPRAPWNAPDTSHEHDFEFRERSPVFEDWAAIFRMECRHRTVLDAEKGYEGEMVVTNAIECEEVRNVRYDASYLWYPNGQGAPVPEPGEELPPRMESALIEVEQAAATGDADIITMEPPDIGNRVVVEYDDWRVIYKNE